MPRVVALIAFVFVAVVAGVATAEPLRGALTVERTTAAAECPDEATLRAAVEAAAGTRLVPDKDANVRFSVRVDRTDAGFVAHVAVSGVREGVRAIDDPGPGCDALAAALALTVAIVLEHAEGLDIPVRPPGLDDTSWFKRYYDWPAIDRATERPPVTRPVPPLALSIGASMTSGVLKGEAFGAVAAANLFIPIVHFGLAFVWFPDDAHFFGEAAAHYEFVGGRARVCTRQPLLEEFGAAVCAGLVAGERTVRTDPPLRPPSPSGAWVAPLLQLEVSRRIVGPFGLYADIGLEIPVVSGDIAVVVPGTRSRLETPEDDVSVQVGFGIRFWLDALDPF